jgi:hypothetical protein
MLLIYVICRMILLSLDQRWRMSCPRTPLALISFLTCSFSVTGGCISRSQNFTPAALKLAAVGFHLIFPGMQFQLLVTLTVKNCLLILNLSDVGLMFSGLQVQWTGLQIWRHAWCLLLSQTMFPVQSALRSHNLVDHLDVGPMMPFC